jgi:hypothetical protein
MSYQNISYVMPADQETEIRNAITLINQRLPFLVNLNPDERRAMLKHADRDTEFVTDANFAVANFPDIFPNAFGAEEYQRDVNLHRLLGEFRILLESLTEKIKNTELALGNEVMKSTNQAYHLIQAAKKTTPGIQKLAEKMALRYKGQGKKKTEPGQPA